MRKVFVSHAFADKPYVEAFVDNVLVRGCGLNPSQDIFYSSGDDTGVPSGADLLHHVREHVESTTLVVALITPMFQTRPVCIAELGAAWGRGGVLFPLLAPGMPRSDLEGVIPSLASRPADDSAVLDELCQRIVDLGVQINMPTWGTGKAKWLSYLRLHGGELEVPKIVTPEQLAQLQTSLDDAQGALDSEVEASEKLRQQLELLKAAKTQEEVKEALLPTDEKERFEALVDDARSALHQVPSIVQEVIWFDLAENGMPWPSQGEDYDAFLRAQNEEREGLLVDDGDGRLSADGRFSTVEEAVNSVSELQAFLKDDPSQEFADWFKGQYKVPADLRKKACWSALLG